MSQNYNKRSNLVTMRMGHSLKERLVAKSRALGLPWSGLMKLYAEDCLERDDLTRERMAYLSTKSVDESYLSESSRVYFIQEDSERGLIKIGWTQHLEDRVLALAGESPYPLRFLRAVPGGRSLEGELHLRFKPHQYAKEWFRPHPDILTYLLALDPG